MILGRTRTGSGWNVDAPQVQLRVWPADSGDVREGPARRERDGESDEGP